MTRALKRCCDLRGALLPPFLFQLWGYQQPKTEPWHSFGAKINPKSHWTLLWHCNPGNFISFFFVVGTHLLIWQWHMPTTVQQVKISILCLKGGCKSKFYSDGHQMVLMKHMGNLPDRKIFLDTLPCFWNNHIQLLQT